MINCIVRHLFARLSGMLGRRVWSVLCWAARFCGRETPYCAAPHLARCVMALAQSEWAL